MCALPVAPWQVSVAKGKDRCRSRPSRNHIRTTWRNGRMSRQIRLSNLDCRRILQSSAIELFCIPYSVLVKFPRAPPCRKPQSKHPRITKHSTKASHSTDIIHSDRVVFAPCSGDLSKIFFILSECLNVFLLLLFCSCSISLQLQGSL